MATLRCTAKLAKAMKKDLVSNPPPATTVLGEWTANLIRIGRINLILAVNERTRLGLAIDAAPYAGVPERFSQQLFKSLLALGVEADRAAAEAGASMPTAFAPSNSRSVLSTLTRYSFDIEAWVYDQEALSATAISQRLLDEIVVEPKHIGVPADRVREAFGLPCKPADRKSVV